LGEQILVTEDGGGYAFLSLADFERFLGGSLQKDEALWKDLQAKGFIKDHLDFQAARRRILDRRPLVWAGPNVHRVLVTERVAGGAEGRDMGLGTARAVVDWIFRTPASGLFLEISGGQPLLNWPIVRFVVSYARARAEKAGRTLAVSLAADADLLDEDRLTFLLGSKIGLWFTLDGPASLHDALRTAWAGADHATTTSWIRKAVELTSGEHEGFAPKPWVRVRVARRSLGREREIVEELVALGVGTCRFDYVGPPSPLAHSSEEPASPEEFVAFYRQAFDHLVRLGLKGKALKESRTLFLARRILAGDQWSQPELEPLDRIAYDPDGAVYVFDDGPDAPLGEGLRVGDVYGLSYNQLLNSTEHRAALAASVLEAQPLCSQCVYRAYCGVHPGASLETQGTIWGRLPVNARCRIAMGLFDHLFPRLQEWEVREKLMARWLEAPTAG